MREFHHIGIPTRKKRPNETYLEGGKVHITDAAADPFRIEWLRFETDSPLPKELQKTPHVAYKVDSLEAELAGRNVILPPFEPMPGLKVAFILHDGAPVEFMQMG